MNTEAVIDALAEVLPPVMRWGGAVARQLRKYQIAVTGKNSGNANTDALTLADLSVQELLVAALRDGPSILRSCRVEGEEETGDMRFFAAESPLAVAIDPIDGTRQYRDQTGNGYSVIAHLHTDETPLYSLVYAPEMGESGTWVEVRSGLVRSGPDNPEINARAALDALPNTLHTDLRRNPSGIYLIGFQQRDDERARQVDGLTVDGLTLKGHTSAEMPGSVYPLRAVGAFSGSLIHSPNIYDFPVSMHIARERGGDAVWVHSREPVHYRTLWIDETAGMLRYPDIVACSESPAVLNTLCDLAADWPRRRYEA